MPKRKPNWLPRAVGAPGPYLILCLSQEEFDVALNELGIPSRPWILSANAHGTTHTYNHEDGDIACIVCIKGDDKTGVQIAALITHEAVHVWQSYLAHIGETRPGVELEAYGIQSISQNLMTEYAERIGGR